MEHESDWVSDVRRWCLTASQAKLPTAALDGETESGELGYEAAHPMLQSRHWPDAPTTGPADLA